MARVTPTELSGSMAVLGLVIEQPNQTVSYIARCLESRFPRARFAPSTAHNALRQMAEAKRKRVLCTHEESGEDSANRYEATVGGLEDFELWMHAMPGAAPVLRDVVYGRVEFSRPANLPTLIKMARLEEAVADDLYQAAARKLSRYRPRPAEPRDFAREIREALLYVEPMRWSERSEAYKVLAKRYEELYREIKLLAPELLRA
ncbi:MAG: hypothetical protein ACRDK4_12165 [Solirubrobacteraceae bacterium]